MALVTRYAAVQLGSAEAIEKCEDEKDCKWSVAPVDGPADDGKMQVGYRLPDGGERGRPGLVWHVDLETGKLSGQNGMTKAMLKLLDDTLQPTIAPKAVK